MLDAVGATVLGPELGFGWVTGCKFRSGGVFYHVDSVQLPTDGSIEDGAGAVEALADDLDITLDEVQQDDPTRFAAWNAERDGVRVSVVLQRQGGGGTDVSLSLDTGCVEVGEAAGRLAGDSGTPILAA